MTASQWIDEHGAPKDWELAVAILEQIESYRSAARILLEVPQERNAMSRYLIPGMPSEALRQYNLECARERVAKPVVDIAAAQKEVRGIEQQGGWAQFVPGLED